MSSDEEFDALPDQSGKRVLGPVTIITRQELVAEPSRWMNLAEKREWYRADMLDALGAEYLAEDTAHQAIYKNFKRSSRKDAKHVRICKHGDTTKSQSSLWGDSGPNPRH